MTIFNIRNSRRKNFRLKSKIIAIDGPAGAGKSTVAKLLAKKLHFLYLDTGAMYRALTLAAIKERANFLDVGSLKRLARSSRIELKKSKTGSLNVYLNERIVNKEIRKPLVTSLVSFVARQRAIREIMLRRQRLIGRKQDSVVEGRDIGTVVFPDSFIKFYLDARLDVRSIRRFKELKLKRTPASKGIIKESIRRRDRSDLTRECAPLKQAADAIYIDTSRLTISEVVNRLLEEIHKANFAKRA